MPDRRMMMAYIMSHQSRLPAEFQEVEYLESTGTQYIDSGVLTDSELRIISKFRCKDNNVSYVFGGRTSSGHNMFSVNYANGYFEAHYGTQNSTQITSMIVNQDYEIDFNKNELKIDNSIYTFTYSQFVSSNNIYIFRQSQLDQLYFNGRFYYFKIYDNNVLIRNFVPCYRKADNVAGLYDLVNGVFYTNAGTGTFIVGGNV